LLLFLQLYPLAVPCPEKGDLGCLGVESAGLCWGGKAAAQQQCAIPVPAQLARDGCPEKPAANEEAAAPFSAMLMWPRSASRPHRSGQGSGSVSAPVGINGQMPWRCAVPAEAAPLIVGSINWELGVRRVTDFSGATLTVSKEGETPRALSDKIVSIWGSDGQKTAACAQVVSKVRQTLRLDDAEPGTFVIIVPQGAVSDIMGVEDARIGAIMLTSGAEFMIGCDAIPCMTDVPIRLKGSLVEVVSAVSQVNGVLQDLVDRGKLSERDFSWRPPGGEDEAPPPLRFAAPPVHEPPPLAETIGEGSLEVSPFKWVPSAKRPPAAPAPSPPPTARAKKAPVPPKLPPCELRTAGPCFPVNAPWIAGGSAEPLLQMLSAAVDKEKPTGDGAVHPGDKHKKEEELVTGGSSDEAGDLEEAHLRLGTSETRGGLGVSPVPSVGNDAGAGRAVRRELRCGRR